MHRDVVHWTMPDDHDAVIINLRVWRSELCKCGHIREYHEGRRTSKPNCIMCEGPRCPRFRRRSQ